VRLFLGQLQEAVRPRHCSFPNCPSCGSAHQVLKGVPVERYTRQESVIAYWIIGMYFGKAVSNNKKVGTDQLGATLQHCHSRHKLHDLPC